MERKKLLSTLASVVVVGALVCAQSPAAERISAAEAKEHIGERATVCGPVASTKYAASSRGRPTFLNLDKPYPGQIFTVLIWGTDHPKFGEPEEKYRDKRICVSGIIKSYRGVPEIIAYEPEQIAVESKQEK